MRPGQGGKDKGSGVLKMVLMIHLTIFSTWNVHIYL